MKVRRIAAKAAIATVGLLAVAGLSACRVESGAAVFVQDQRIAETQVDAVVDSAPEAFGNDIGPIRQWTVSSFAVVELARQYAADNGTALPGPDYAGVAEAAGGESAFTRLYAEQAAYGQTLFTEATAVQPTEADVADLRIGTFSQINASLDAEQAAYVEEAISQAATGEAFSQSLGKRDLLNSLFAEYDVVANPRYGAPTVTVAQVAVAPQVAYSVTVPLPTTAS
ncbi:hypothetical protein [Phytomonospora endophytica]|uniref:Lipoprotein n=1 Tax=Phytomonospora endophytica TaxID=714109 RepID=A0A841FC60_9ACTN|nr:hypothetical protein [Phytomonospora endophytica]MBB6033374.1 hypothetical protein [Phytomonospora endophytica]